MPRADRQTETSIQQEFYSDFSIDFSKNPITGALARLSNEDSVKQSIKILILSIVGEWPHANRLGSLVSNQIFELIDDISASVLESTIQDVLRKFEPRIATHKVLIGSDPDNHQYNIQILFTLKNTNISSSVGMILKRTR